MGRLRHERGASLMVSDGCVIVLQVAAFCGKAGNWIRAGKLPSTRMVCSLLKHLLHSLGWVGRQVYHPFSMHAESANICPLPSLLLSLAAVAASSPGGTLRERGEPAMPAWPSPTGLNLLFHTAAALTARTFARRVDELRQGELRCG